MSQGRERGGLQVSHVGLLRGRRHWTVCRPHHDRLHRLQVRLLQEECVYAGACFFVELLSCRVMHKTSIWIAIQMVNWIHHLNGLCINVCEAEYLHHSNSDDFVESIARFQMHKVTVSIDCQINQSGLSRMQRYWHQRIGGKNPLRLIMGTIQSKFPNSPKSPNRGLIRCAGVWRSTLTPFHSSSTAFHCGNGHNPTWMHPDGRIQITMISSGLASLCIENVNNGCLGPIYATH